VTPQQAVAAIQFRQTVRATTRFSGSSTRQPPAVSHPSVASSRTLLQSTCEETSALYSLARGLL